jgi:hypothetical protein
MSYWSETLKEIFLDPPEGAGGWTILLKGTGLLKVSYFRQLTPINA